MKNCKQNKHQTIYEHGVSVRNHLNELIEFIYDNAPLDDKWKLPEWLTTYKDRIKEKLLPKDIILEYALFHDVGKPRCLVEDAQGSHFPDHANVSADYWIESGGDPQIGRLIRMDMDIHLLKNDGVPEFCQRTECITLLLTGLAEVHSNASMFGGKDSTSFKIKWKQINKRGNAIFNN